MLRIICLFAWVPFVVGAVVVAFVSECFRSNR